jgi:hypothetical protein
MPLRDEQRAAQTIGVGAVFVSAAKSIVDLNDRLRATARVQGAVALALGAEVGFFDEANAERLLGDFDIQPDDVRTLGLGSSPVVADRVRQIAEQGLVAPGYRPRLSASDASLIAFRSVLLPLVRSWQSPLHLPAFFERVTSRTDFHDEPATVIDALRYLDTATHAIRAAAEGVWLPEDELFGRDSWLAAELALLYQIQVDTSNPSAKFRLRELAEALTHSTVGETRKLVLDEQVNKQTQAEWLTELERRAEEWRSEALEIIERFDAALPAAATAAGA